MCAHTEVYKHLLLEMWGHCFQCASSVLSFSLYKL